MVLTITTAGLEACPGSSRGPREKGVEMVSKGFKKELDSEGERGKQLEGKKCDWGRVFLLQKAFEYVTYLKGSSLERVWRYRVWAEMERHEINSIGQGCPHAEKRSWPLSLGERRCKCELSYIFSIPLGSVGSLIWYHQFSQGSRKEGPPVRGPFS